MEGGPPGFGRGFTCPVLLGNSLGCPCISRKGLSPALAGLSRPFCYAGTMPCRAPATPRGKPRGLASSGFARHYSRNLVLISAPRGTEMFHFPRCSSARLCIQRAVAGQTPAGFPHSEIPGSKPAHGSPGLIAVNHVLHRLLAPRHPSCARMCLTETKPRLSVDVASSCPKLCQIVKEHHRPKADPAPRPRRGEIVCRKRAPGVSQIGGRAWSRTRDLVLIRDAL